MENNKKMKNEQVKKVGIKTIKNIAFISKILFYFTYIFNLLVLWDKAKFTDAVGHMELYSSSFPSWVIKLAEMFTTVLFVYLGTVPT
ncbi:O-antigen polysaccharide polymerase Wzy [Bacillus mycoides]|uniref:O-antigen polysaccharide polymerase Wzy n=1 Tax=Bacillus mycoides TaxID=1405 RepID=UPI002078FAC7|nr:O-antigen polysaccharide polymerase Wzy [Bacillus mycoides]